MVGDVKQDEENGVEILAKRFNVADEMTVLGDGR